MARLCATRGRSGRVALVERARVPMYLDMAEDWPAEATATRCRLCWCAPPVPEQSVGR